MTDDAFDIRIRQTPIEDPDNTEDFQQEELETLLKEIGNHSSIESYQDRNAESLQTLKHLLLQMNTQDEWLQLTQKEDPANTEDNLTLKGFRWDMIQNGFVPHSGTRYHITDRSIPPAVLDYFQSISSNEQVENEQEETIDFI